MPSLSVVSRYYAERVDCDEELSKGKGGEARNPRTRRPNR